MSAPGVAIHPVPAGAEVRIDIGPAQTPGAEAAARMASMWDELCAANDRYYDGPILRAVSVDTDAGSVLCRRDTFRSLASSARLGLGVRQLGVCGVLVGRDATGAKHLLLGRRAADTRIYPGLWEVAPSGGVKPPAPNVAVLTLLDLALALAEEADEELGMTLDPRNASLIAFLRDDIACSDDAVLRFDLPAPIDPRRAPGAACALAPDAGDRWEYIDTAWIALIDLPAFVRDHADAIAPPTAALVGWLGWA
jgi:8-oxo-dGTP pyrophosphatase MutT (NUDIX family)